MDKKQPEAQERKFWKRLCALNRFSFFILAGGVARASDKSGNWIEVHSAQEIVDDAECEVSALTARITELESQLAQRFDAADVATASAQGFRDGVASVSVGSEPEAAEESRLYGDAKLAHDQCRAVVHLAHMLAEVYQANALILAAGQGPVEIIGEASAEVMEILGDIINSTDAMDEDDLWLDPIYDAAQARWPAERATRPGPADGESNG